MGQTSTHPTTHGYRARKESMTYEIKGTHYGQKRAYGDSFYEYEITSDEDLTKEFIEKLVSEKQFYKYPVLMKQPSRSETAKDFGLNFATYLQEIRRITDKKWFVVIVSPSTH